MIQLRPYQESGIRDIRAAYGRGINRVLYVGVTGSGKTVLFAAVCNGAVQRGTQVLILCHRIELVDQIARALTAIGIDFGYVAAEYPESKGKRVYVASVQTYARRLDKYPAPGLIVQDEAHHSLAASFRAIYARYPQAKMLGVTATPCRTDGTGLREIFEEMIVGPTMGELIELGFLSKYKLYQPPTVDTSGLHTRYGEYIASEAEALVNRGKITGDAIKHYQRICDGIPALAFCNSIKHAEEVAGRFREAGYNAVHMYGGMHKDIRRDIIGDYRDGRIHVVSSADILIEGVDLPGAKCGIFLRPTQSTTVHMQSIGRLLRPSADHEFAFLIDHVGNTKVPGLGYPDDPREWTLDGEKRKDKKTSISDRVCPKCWMSLRSTQRTCECGYEFPVKSRQAAEVDGELVEATEEQREAERRLKTEAHIEELQCRDLVDWKRLAKKRGKSSGWAVGRFSHAGKRPAPEAMAQIIEDLRHGKRARSVQPDIDSDESRQREIFSRE